MSKIGQTALLNHAAGEGHRVGTSLHTNHPTPVTHAGRQEPEAAFGAAADLDNPVPGANANAIEQPLRLRSELLRLLEQALLLGLAIAEQVLVVLSHVPPPFP